MANAAFCIGLRGMRSRLALRSRANTAKAISDPPTNIPTPMRGITHHSGCSPGFRVSVMLENMRHGRNTSTVTSERPLTTVCPITPRATRVHAMMTMMAIWETARKVAPKTVRKSAPKRAQPGNRLPQHQCVDVVRPFVGVDALQVRQVPHRLVFGEDPVGAQETSGLARDLRRHVHVVPLGERDLLGGHGALVLEPTKLHAEKLGFGDLGKHLRQAGLLELKAADRPVEHHPGLGITHRFIEAGHRRPDRAPGNSVAGLSEAQEGALEATTLG